MVAEIVAGIVLVWVSLAEVFHYRRVRKLSPLAFGGTARVRSWGYAAPVVRILAVAFLAWGMTVLLSVEPRAYRPAGEIQPGKEQHLMIVLDVSPSMRLQDAGPDKKQTRKARARDVMRSLMERVPAEQFLVSVIAVYSGAKPVVVDSKDLDVVDAILGDLPLYQAFDAGQTRLLEGLRSAANVSKPWNPSSGTVILISDGDTVPPQGMPTMPASIGNVLVVGIGDPTQGSFIDGRQSKQDVFTLRQIATRLNGTYHDGNQRQIPSSLIAEIQSRSSLNQQQPWTRREYALLAVGIAGFCLSLLPYLLEQFGMAHQPGIRKNLSTLLPQGSATPPVTHSIPAKP